MSKELPWELQTCPVDLVSNLPNLNIDLIEPVGGGLVHRVFKILRENNNATFAKIRGKEFARINGLTTDPAKIDQEHRISKALQRSNFFPQVESYNKEKFILVLSDISEGGSWFEEFLDKNELNKDLVTALASNITQLHNELKQIPDNTITQVENESEYKNNLQFRLRKFNIPEINATVNLLLDLPKQYIFGDLSPKNLYWNTDEQNMRYCDLEMVHRGNPEFDHAFFVSHLLLHQTSNHQAIFDYYFDNITVDVSKDDFVKLVFGLLLYRLINSKIPYTQSKFNPAQKFKIAQNILKNISQPDLNRIFEIEDDELEVESKILNIDKASVVSQLEKLGAICILEEDTRIQRWDISDHKKLNGDFADSKIAKILENIKNLTTSGLDLDNHNAYLRIRNQAGQLELTLKVGKTDTEQFKSEEEINMYFEESEEESINGELTKYGFEVKSNEIKNRQSFLLFNGTRVDIDTWIIPSIPTYIEIEGSQEQITLAASQLGFEANQLSNITGKELFKKHAN